jgi:pimeloyl-ACP methyl ester carboxylesterase
MKSEHTFQFSHVVSADGTKIGYRQIGNGPGLILVHGALQASQNFTQLGELLSNDFTVYIPDRRGRKMSDDFGANHSIQKECEDLYALIQKTGTNNVFGLSAGAVIVLRAANLYHEIQKAAVYEPPVSVNPTNYFSWHDRYLTELDEQKPASCFVTIVKATDDSLMRFIPRFIFTWLIGHAMKAEKEKDENHSMLINLISTMKFDGNMVRSVTGNPGLFIHPKGKVMFMSGSKSRSFLKKSVREMHNLTKGSVFVEIKGVGHIASDNAGKPRLVASELVKFFK